MSIVRDLAALAAVCGLVAAIAVWADIATALT